jgi:hypothetical protein
MSNLLTQRELESYFWGAATLHEIGTTDPRNRLHNKHPNPALDHYESQRKPRRKGGADWTPITPPRGSLFHA